MCHKMKGVLSAAILLLLLTAALFAQEEAKPQNPPDDNIYLLTVDEAVRIAKESNFTLKQNKITMEQSTRRYKHSWNIFLPSINGTVSATENDGIKESVQNTGILNTQINGSLAINGAIGPKLKLLRNQYNSGLLDYDDAVRTLETDVRSAFYNLLFYEDQLVMYEKSLESYQVQYNQTKIKRDYGLVPELDYLSAQTNLEGAKTDLKEAEKTYINALLVFLNQICFDIPEGKTVKLHGSLEECTRISKMLINKDEIPEYVRNCPTIRKLNAKLNEAELTKSQTICANWTPTLNMSAGVIPYKLTEAWGAKKEGVSSDGWNATFSVTVPISDYIYGSAKWDAIKELDDSIAKLKLQIQEQTRSVTTQVDNLLRSIDVYMATLERNRLNCELSKKTFEMAQEAYNRGTKDLIYLENMKTAYESAELKLASQEYILISNVYTLRNLLGLDIEEVK